MRKRMLTRVSLDTDSIEYKKFQKGLYEQRGAFWEEAEKETDRGFVLVALAHFENKLSQCLLEYFVEDSMAEELIAPSGPLGSFSAKLKCCVCLGIIGEDIYKMLRNLAAIRNAFAHEVVVDFRQEAIASKVSSAFSPFEKASPGIVGETAARDQFSIMCLLIEGYLFSRPTEVAIFRDKIPQYIPTYISNPDAT